MNATDKAQNSKKKDLINQAPVYSHLTFEDANRKLRFVIGSLQGKYESSCWKRRVQTALIVKEELLANGYFWHAERIDNWIHRLQTSIKKSDLLREERRLQTNG